MTVDVEPDPARHSTQGWIYAFANGEAGYPQEWTKLRSSDWHACDPGRGAAAPVEPGMSPLSGTVDRRSAGV